jgi:hypothetical protein
VLNLLPPKCGRTYRSPAKQECPALGTNEVVTRSGDVISLASGWEGAEPQLFENK